MIHLQTSLSVFSPFNSDMFMNGNFLETNWNFTSFHSHLNISILFRIILSTPCKAQLNLQNLEANLQILLILFTLEMYSCTLFQPDPDRNGDNNSDSGSFHASVWEEERSKRSLVKWAGDESLDLDKTGNLRR